MLGNADQAYRNGIRGVFFIALTTPTKGVPNLVLHISHVFDKDTEVSDNIKIEQRYNIKGQTYIYTYKS